jgi:hypothetical protein
MTIDTFANLLRYVQPLTLLIMIGIALIAWRKSKQLKKTQEQLIQAIDKNSASHWIRVNIASAQRFKKRFKIVPFDAKGIVINHPEHIQIQGQRIAGQKISRTIDKRDLHMDWIGNPNLASSNMHWIRIKVGGQSVYLSADTGMNALQSREATADLCRMINPHFKLPSTALNEFALEKNPASLTAVLVFFALMAFAFGDGLILNSHELLKLGGAAWAMPVAALLPLPAYALLTRQKVPSRESLALTSLLSVALLLSVIPVLKRVDQLLSTDGAVSTAYRLDKDAQLKPVTEGPPVLDFGHQKEYWAQFEEGSVHHFDLTHGPLGLWQLDHAKLDQPVRDFYKNKSL